MLLGLVIIALFFEANIKANAASVCLSHDCASCDRKRQISLYHQHCCLPENNGKRFELRENDLVTRFVCPTKGLPYVGVCQEVRGPIYHSCSEVLERSPNAVSGYYNITQISGLIVSVYCGMEGDTCDGNGGWMRIAYTNMTQPNATCPQGLFQYDFNNKALCDRNHLESGNGCSATFFSSGGLNYRKVCGKVRGYQYGCVDGIYFNNGVVTDSIDDAYVDGVSITHGNNPCQHIWTYVAGDREHNNGVHDCPCNINSTETTPSYVGNDYYCESGASAWCNIINYFPDDPLWDGQECDDLESPCCTSSALPWFVKTLIGSTDDDIELRICTSEGYPNEATPLDIIELYVK